MDDYKEYVLQVLCEETWVNYSLRRTLQKAIKMALEELTGNPFRILGYDGEKWVECLIRGSMLSVMNKDFRILNDRKGAICCDSVVEISRLLSGM